MSKKSWNSRTCEVQFFEIYLGYGMGMKTEIVIQKGHYRTGSKVAPNHFPPCPLHGPMVSGVEGREEALDFLSDGQCVKTEITSRTFKDIWCCTLGEECNYYHYKDAGDFFLGK